MKVPRIGITPYRREEGNIQYIPPGYLRGVQLAGGEPVLIRYETRPEEMDALLSGLDGLLLSGGPDVDPSRYGRAREEKCGPSFAPRDEMEIALLKRAMQRDLPILGICRGIQLITAALGGTLIQDVPTFYGDLHQQPPESGPFFHEVTLTEHTRLRSILGCARLMVDSYHHQCVETPAPGFVVSARGPRGIIEAVERPASRFLAAVQWHPEVTLGKDAYSLRIFDAFLRAVWETK